MTTATTHTLTGLRVNIDGTIEEVRIEGTSQNGHVDALNRAVGSDTFIIVGLADGIDVFVDHEGLYRAEHNPVLSVIVRDLIGAPEVHHLHGAGVFLGTNAHTGDTLSLTPTQRATVAAAWFAAAPITAL